MHLANIFSIQRIRKLHAQYESELSAMAVVTGFVVDSLTLRRIDLWAENLVILSLLCIAATAIVLMQLYNDGRLRQVKLMGRRIFAQADWWLSLVMQFAFGGLFSAFLVFYGRSGAILANWPFFLILVGLLVGNEIFRRRYRRLYFNTLVLFLALFAYLIFAVPLVTHALGPFIFLLSGGLALLGIWGFTQLLGWLSPTGMRIHKRAIRVSVSAMFLLIVGLYFLNLIPPIPLSLQEAKVAHDIRRTSAGAYELQVQQHSWYSRIVPGQHINVTSGAPLYFYSAVFAPTDFQEQIVHNWQYHRDAGWVSVSRINYSLVGGRAGGYRGYSFKENLQPGRWRVRVETSDGRILGQKSFNVSYSDSSPQLKTLTR